MQTRKKLFDKTVFLKNLSRTWLIGLGILFLMYLNMVLRFFMDVTALPESGDGEFEYQVLNCIADNIGMNRYYAIIGGILMAVMVFGYIQKSRSVSFYHSLPISREGLYFTGILSTLLILFVPNLLISAVMAIQLRIMGYSAITEIMCWMLVICTEELFYFALALLCMMLCGNEIISIILYAALIYVPAFIYQFGVNLMKCLAYGYENSGEGSYYLNRISPEYVFDNIYLKITQTPKENGFTVTHEFVGLESTITVILIISVIMLAVALILYKTRRSEAAGDLIAFRWFKPIADGGVVAILGYIIIVLFIGGLSGGTFRGYSAELKTIVVAGLAAVGFIGYLAVRKFTEKMKFSFAKSIVPCLVFSVIMAAMGFGIITLSDKIEKYVPEADEIESVAMYGSVMMNDEMADIDHRYQISISDPEMIKKFLSCCKKATEGRENWLEYGSSRGVEKYTFVYTLKETEIVGGVAEQQTSALRYYSISREDRFYETLEEFLNANLIDYIKDGKKFNQMIVNTSDGSQMSCINNTADVERLLEALREDVKEGRLSSQMAMNGTPFLEGERECTAYTCFMNSFDEKQVNEEAGFGMENSRGINFTENCTAAVKVLKELFGEE